MVFQQLLFADEVRSLRELNIEHVSVSDSELKLAIQIIEQGAEDNYDASAYEDEEKKRILAAIDRKIEGKEIVAAEAPEAEAGGEVIDLMEALRASLAKTSAKATKPAAAKRKTAAKPVEEVAEVVSVPKARKPAARALKVAATEAPAKVRARK
jgi:DNA end-binding protein Ku